MKHSPFHHVLTFLAAQWACLVHIGFGRLLMQMTLFLWLMLITYGMLQTVAHPSHWSTNVINFLMALLFCKVYKCSIQKPTKPELGWFNSIFMELQKLCHSLFYPQYGKRHVDDLLEQVTKLDEIHVVLRLPRSYQMMAQGIVDFALTAM